VEDSKGDVGSGRIDGLHARLVLVVPNLDCPIRAGQVSDESISHTALCTLGTRDSNTYLSSPHEIKKGLSPP
jgi:hypothetical protein